MLLAVLFINRSLQRWKAVPLNVAEIGRTVAAPQPDIQMRGLSISYVTDTRSHTALGW